MAAMDAVAIQTLVAEAVKQALEAQRTGGGDRTGGSIHKHYTRLDTLVPEEWKEWHY